LRARVAASTSLLAAATAGVGQGRWSVEVGNGKAAGKLQRKLYCKAKAEPAFRFYVLYDKICREDILRHAYGLARANAGAPGVDVSFEQIEERGLEAWLAGLREELVSKTYRPDPVRRVMIPKNADDFVILSRGRAAEALTWTKAVMTKLGLTLKEAKTSLRDARQECFTFLGFCVLQRHRERRSARNETCRTADYESLC